MQPYTDRTKLLSSYKKADECKLNELVQYQCEVGSTHIECNPFVRLFLKCSNMPMIEVTPEYDQNGDVKVSILPDFGSVDGKKSPPGFVMMENKN
ncbi:hypothetical protein BJ944DRAFT_258399 [Cunninghamella echinulata]|nr:hypothetical protein BJ944DRAFT_258399 [Cunninghamella echinulata]